MSGRRYNPWRILRDLWPHIEVDTYADLPEGVTAIVHGRWILLRRTLTQRGRRCTLAHEIAHLERGEVPDHAHYAQREESVVERIAAQRLIELDALADALRWTQHHAELADELWVDEPMLQARLNALTPVEVRYLRSQLEEVHAE